MRGSAQFLRLPPSASGESDETLVLDADWMTRMWGAEKLLFDYQLLASDGDESPTETPRRPCRVPERLFLRSRLRWPTEMADGHDRPPGRLPSHSRPEPTCVSRWSAPPRRARHRLQQPSLWLSLSTARARKTATRKHAEARDRFANADNLIRRRAPNWSLAIALGQQTIQPCAISTALPTNVIGPSKAIAFCCIPIGF
jgi:hypothetical protein